MIDDTQIATISRASDPSQPLIFEADNNKIIMKRNSIDPTERLPVSESEQQAKNRLRPPTSTSWKPGESGNPNGRPPKNWTWKDLLEEAMDEKDATGVPVKKIIVKRMVELAKRGDLQATKEIIDRMDGKAKQSTDLQTQGDFTVVLAREPRP